MSGSSPMRFWERWLVVVLVWPGLSGSLFCEAPFEGLIRIAEVIEGQEAGRQERAELERYAVIVRARLERIHQDLTTAPPVVAQVLTEDESAAKAELDRIALGGGGSLRLSSTTYHVSKGRLLLVGADLQLLVDRNRQTVQALSGGEVRLLDLATPSPIGDAGGDGEPVLGRPTRTYTCEVGTSRYRVQVIADLPNVYAMALLSDAPADSLPAVLARLPGLPAVVETRDGRITRRLIVEAIEPAPVSDDRFRPWR